MQLLDRFQMGFRGGLCPRTEVQGYTILDVISASDLENRELYTLIVHLQSFSL
jgi:hypothetical protein